MAGFNRLMCIKCDIKSLKKGDYVIKEGWSPNFVKTKYGDVSRVNVIGVVVSVIDEKEFVIDDSTEQIGVRSFDTVFPVKVGEFVAVIGRPREYGGERYIYPEIVKKVDRGWQLFRRKELEYLKDDTFIEEKRVEMPNAFVEHNNNAEGNVYEKIINAIRSLDKGDGVLKSEILGKFGDDAEDALNRLMQEGEIFENAPGKIKVL